MTNLKDRQKFLVSMVQSHPNIPFEAFDQLNKPAFDLIKNKNLINIYRNDYYTRIFSSFFSRILAPIEKELVNIGLFEALRSFVVETPCKHKDIAAYLAVFVEKMRTSSEASSAILADAVESCLALWKIIEFGDNCSVDHQPCLNSPMNEVFLGSCVEVYAPKFAGTNLTQIWGLSTGEDGDALLFLGHCQSQGIGVISAAKGLLPFLLSLKSGKPLSQSSKLVNEASPASLQTLVARLNEKKRWRIKKYHDNN